MFIENIMSWSKRELRKCLITQFLTSLVLLLHTFAQNCQDGIVCGQPPILELNSSSADKVNASSFCNITYKLTNGTLNNCPPPNQQIYNLVDKIIQILPDGETFVDGDYSTFWVSEPTSDALGGFKEEFIVANFTDMFLITSVEVYFRNPSSIPTDMRPRAMEIQGFNGGSWVTWEYFAENCVSTYSKFPTDKLFADVSVCENRDTLPMSTLSEGNFLVSFRPGELFENIYNNYTIQKFFMASAIQFKFKIPPITDNVDTSYYVVSNINIRYQCACFGHASQCTGQYGGQCVCQHNTNGTNCQQCLPLYNNSPWQPASYNNTFECQACNCNNRSTSCENGQCTNCLYETSGPQCNLCNDGYFFNPANSSVLSNSALNCTGYNCFDVCIPCNCNMIGSINGVCNSSIGQCPCKSRVTGLTCDTCTNGSYNLSPANTEGCSSCDCNIDGMLTCNKTSGNCVCKNYIFGSKCEGCQDGYYNISSGNQDGCMFCDCDVGASTGTNCEINLGGCNCKPYTTGRNCRTTVDTYFGPSLNFHTFEAEYSVNVSDGDIVERVGGGSTDSTFTGRGFLTITPLKPVVFNVQVLVTAWYQLVLRYESPVQVPVSVTLKPISILPSPLPALCQNSTNSVFTGNINVVQKSGFSSLAGTTCMVSSMLYELTLTVQSSTVFPGSQILLDSLVLLPVIDNLTSFVISNDSMKSQMKQCLEVEKMVNPVNRTSLRCPEIGYSVMIDLNSAAYACNCDPSGSYNQSCSPIGGQCPCRPNVFLGNCTQCKVNSYGFSIPNGCIDCGCHPNGSTTLRCNETGLCQCKTNVVGDKCDRCVDKNYGLASGNGCQPCQCSGIYVVNDTCMDNGQCFCKPGVAGLHCDTCAPGYYGLSSIGCSSCGCNMFGSSTTICNPSSAACACRSAVTGFYCDTCKPGYFGLGPYSEGGCIRCYCSGKSTNCTSAPGWYQAYSEFKWGPFQTVVGNKWDGIGPNGNNVTVGIGVYLNTTSVLLQIKNNDTSHSPLFFVSPNVCTENSCFNGYKAMSYGQWLNITLMLNINPSTTSSPIPTTSPPVSFPYPAGDVIIKGTFVNYSLVTSLKNMPNPDPTVYEIRINESVWFKDNVSSGIHPTYEEMIQLLYDVQSIMIRAKFSDIIDSVTSLVSVMLGYGVNQLTGDRIPIPNVEQCVCPANYEGLFCETCSAGYTKVGGNCVLCNCNGHEFPGTTCDPLTGNCNCIDQTTGNHCELCLPGYYGDATQKLPDSCKACMCPGNVNDPQALVHSSSKTCNTTSGNTFICNCDLGYNGSQCESCIAGFSGSPTNRSINNGNCQGCNCNGFPNECDRLNGTCFKCGGNTTGLGCLHCLPNYYSNRSVSFSKMCDPCNCNTTGFLSCPSTNGICNCKPGVDPNQNTKCSTCFPGYYNFSDQGCTPCNCNAKGTINSNTNCSATGVCPCSPNFLGDKCDRCNGNYYGDNCNISCSCNTNYTVNGNNSCRFSDGQCQCQEGFGGQQCSACENRSVSPNGITNVEQGAVFPNCSICGSCHKGLAGKAVDISRNMSNMNTLIMGLISNNFGNLASGDIRSRLNTSESPLNSSNASIIQLQSLYNNLNNISLFDVPARTDNFTNTLDRFNGNYGECKATFDELNKVDENDLKTGQNETPNVQLNNINITLLSKIKSQNSMFTQGDETFNSIQTSNSLVQNQPNSIDALEMRVVAVNSTMDRVNLILTGTNMQMSNINLTSLAVKISTETNYFKSMTSLMSSLATDLDTAQFYVDNIIGLYDNGKANLAESNKFYNNLNQQLSGSLQNISNDARKAAQAANNSAGQFCNSSKSLNSDVTNALTSLSKAQNQLINSSLNQNNIAMDRIINTNLEQYSSQIGAVVNAISLATVQGDVGNTSSYVDNVSVVAQNLTNLIQDAVNKTQQTKAKVDQLQSNINSATTKGTEAKNCLAIATSRSNAIKSNINSVALKANKTKIDAQTTRESINNATNMYKPINSSFTNITDNMKSSLEFLKLSNNTLNTAQEDHTKNSNDLTLLNTNFAAQHSEYDTWMTTKNQVDACINDLQSSLSNLNQPIKLSDLVNQTHSQMDQVQQLQNDINTLENEINRLLASVNILGPETATCKDAV